jgi:hypothetical protein
MKKLPIIVLMLLVPLAVFAVQFEELDKPPEGAHKGQMMLGAFATIGAPYGKIISAEKNFVRYSTYTFLDNLVTKRILLQHLSFSYGLFYEYMPIDYFGLKVKMRRSIIVQRTQFGAEYQNWTNMLYNDYSFFLGPSVHFTARKQWDFSLTPLVGYALGKYNATPIADGLVYDLNTLTLNQILFWYAGKRKKQAYNVVIGGEFNFLIFFSGGFMMSFGFDWIMNMLKFNGKFFLMNPQVPYLWFFPNKNSSYVHSYCFILSAGYAFSN